MMLSLLLCALTVDVLAAEPAVDPAVDPAAPSAEELPPLVKDPQLLQFVEAPYPEEAKAAGIEGKVLLAIEIDAAGAVVNAEVLRAAGYGFDEAAVAAAKAFVFSPAEDATGPVPVIIEFEYGFTMDAPPPPEVVEAAPVEQPINLEGVLLEMGTRRPLADVTVRVEASGGAGIEATTDKEGRFSFRGVPVGDVTIRVVQPGYDPLAEALAVTEGEVTDAKLWLRNRSYGDAGIIGVYRKEQTEVTRRTITMEEIKRIPGTFGDPIRVVQNLPGAARAPFGTGVLVIRGSNPEDSGVYIDGIRIPYIYHLGGYESVINPDLVAAVDYLPGGFGVQYGRNNGGVVDVSTRTEFPERIKVTWSTDILDSGAMVMGAVGKNNQHGFGVAARRSYIDALLPLFLGDSGYVVKPRWYDYQAKYQYQGDGPNKFSFLVFGFEDILRASTPSGTAQGTDQDTQGDLRTAYATHRVMFTYERSLGGDWSLRFVPAAGIDYANIFLGNDWRIEQRQYLTEIRLETPWKPSERFELVPGVDFIGGTSPFSIELPFDPSSLASTDPLAEREPYVLSETQGGWGPDLYLFARIRPLKDKDRLLIVPGVRTNYVVFPGEFQDFSVDPRISSRFQIVEGTTIKGAVGLYHQPPQPFEAYRPDDGFAEVHSERTLSTSLGLEQDLSKAIHAELEVFYKDLDRLIVTNPNFTSLSDPYFLNEGVGRSYGLEVMIKHDPIDRLFGWVSYTLSRSVRQDYPGEDWYLFDLDQTHIFVTVAGYKLPYNFEISAKAQYVTGNPTTPYSLGVYDVDQDYYQAFQTGERNSERLPPYWTASLRLDKLFTFKTWQLDLYLDVLNLVHGINPEFEVYNYDYTESTYISGLPTIPGPGFEAKFEF